MNGLMLHCGANVATLDEVKTVATPAPTDSFCPIAHATLYDLVRAELESQGMKLTAQTHGLYRDGQRYFGLLELAGEQDDYSVAVGIRNTHDQSFSAALVMGSRVFVCDNLAFSGEVLIARKHTTYIERDLPALTNRAVALLSDKRAGQAHRIEVYKQTELTRIAAHDLAIAALDSRVVPVTKLPAVLQEWRHPSHPEFEPRTLWSFENAITEVLKGTNVFELGRRTLALHGIMDRVAGLGEVAGLGQIEDAQIQVAVEGGQVNARDVGE